MDNTGRAEWIIEEKIGCGPFQIIIVIVLFTFIKISSLFTFIFMSYGNYNPGWRCLDNDTLYQSYTNDSLQSLVTNVNASVDYFKDFTCQQYEACERVEFNPESSTVVTEWGLVCDRAWISSFIISIQMAGNLVGSFFSGQAADTFGRKKTLYGALLVNIILSIISIFSTSWEMFAASRFLIGFDSAFFESLNYVYPAEFLSRKWRGPLMGIPGWPIGGIMFGVISMFVKSWKHLLLASCVVYGVSFLPVMWIPESLRWLEVKNKTKDFKEATQKMAKLNGKTLSKLDILSFDIGQSTQMKQTAKMAKKPTYSVFDLFRAGYRCTSLVIAVGWLFLSVIFFAISFGIKALNGNFYINFILIYTISIPFCIFPLFATNLLGRRKASCVFILACGIFSLSAMSLELLAAGYVKVMAVLILVILGLTCSETAWTSQQVHLTELYPTVVRGLAMNWANVMARIGGIAAPFIIPRDSDNVFVWYLIMGCMAIISCGLFAMLPETKGKPLKETFEHLLEITVNVDNDDHMEQVLRVDDDGNAADCNEKGLHL